MSPSSSPSHSKAYTPPYTLDSSTKPTDIRSAPIARLRLSKDWGALRRRKQLLKTRLEIDTVNSILGPIFLHEKQSVIAPLLRPIYRLGNFFFVPATRKELDAVLLIQQYTIAADAKLSLTRVRLPHQVDPITGVKIMPRSDMHQRAVKLTDQLNTQFITDVTEAGWRDLEGCDIEIEDNDFEVTSKRSNEEGRLRLSPDSQLQRVFPDGSYRLPFLIWEVAVTQHTINVEKKVNKYINASKMSMIFFCIIDAVRLRSVRRARPFSEEGDFEIYLTVYRVSWSRRNPITGLRRPFKNAIIPRTQIFPSVGETGGLGFEIFRHDVIGPEALTSPNLDNPSIYYDVSRVRNAAPMWVKRQIKKDDQAQAKKLEGQLSSSPAENYTELVAENSFTAAEEEESEDEWEYERMTGYDDPEDGEYIEPVRGAR